jgi:hypothetical protein
VSSSVLFLGLLKILESLVLCSWAAYILVYTAGTEYRTYVDYFSYAGDLAV